MADTPPCILRIKSLAQYIGLSGPTIYCRIRAGTFPPPIRLGIQSVGWLKQEVDAWIASQPRAAAGRNSKPNGEQAATAA